MADYARADANFLHGRVSDFSDGLLNRTFSKSYTTPTKAFPFWGLSAAITTGTTIDLGGLNITSVLRWACLNLDSTNFVEVRWTDQSNTNKAKITAGEWGSLPLATVAADFVIIADTAACLVDFILFGT